MNKSKSITAERVAEGRERTDEGWCLGRHCEASPRRRQPLQWAPRHEIRQQKCISWSENSRYTADLFLPT